MQDHILTCPIDRGLTREQGLRDHTLTHNPNQILFIFCFPDSILPCHHPLLPCFDGHSYSGDSVASVGWCLCWIGPMSNAPEGQFARSILSHPKPRNARLMRLARKLFQTGLVAEGNCILLRHITGQFQGLQGRDMERCAASNI